MLTETGVVASWNPRAASLTGYTLPEINTVGLAQVFDQPHGLEHLIQEAKAGAPTLGTRLMLKRADGALVPVDVRCSPLRHLGGIAGRVVVVMRDLSDLEILQDRLLQSERLSILGRLAGALSHEIRNPLAAIFLHADILEDELQQPGSGDRAQLLRSLAAIKEEVSRLHDLVQQYLSLARLPELRREPLDLGAYLKAFGQEMQERLEARNIALRLEGISKVGWVALHRNSFRRVLLNLFNNALEAMPQGGILTLRAGCTADRVCLAVSDTGCGIPAAQVPLLFSPFHSTKPEGTGLGLYLAREIIAAHQGEITVTSAPGVGTTFTVLLPLLMLDDMQPERVPRGTEGDDEHSDRG
jgi:two-component system sensor histidine kinase AtoS